MRTRQEIVEYFADGVRSGKHERVTNFLWDEPPLVIAPKGWRVVITDEVLAAAGPETPEETAAREVERERRLPLELAMEIEEDVSFYWSREIWTARHMAGHDFRVTDRDDIDEDRLVIERLSDGKLFEVEFDVHVTPL